MKEDKNGIPFIGHDAALEILEHAYGITPSDDDCYHERIEEKLAEKDICVDSVVELIERLMPMINHGKCPWTSTKYKGFGKIKMIGDQPQRMELIGKVPEDFWFIEDGKGVFQTGVFKEIDPEPEKSIISKAIEDVRRKMKEYK